jgi:uncharacterized membrane protein (UPF0127 family)
MTRIRRGERRTTVAKVGMQTSVHHSRVRRVAQAALCLAALAGGCIGSTGTNSGDAAGGSSDALRQYPLGTLPTSTVTINEHVFRVWLAQEFDPHRPGVQQEGLMFVRPREIADDQGMLFVFSDERIRSFWMRNTIVPLDIAFARFDGTIVSIRQMPPLTWQSFSSIEPAMFALEVKQGTLARLGIREGDRMVIPDTALLPAP